MNKRRTRFFNTKTFKKGEVKMKKIICLVLIFILLTCLISCDDNTTSDSPSQTSTTSSSGTKKASGSSAKCSHASCAENGPFYCMGKNDTCPNQTGCAYDLYCDSCD